MYASLFSISGFGYPFLLDFYLPWFYNRSKIDLLRRFRMPVNLSIKNVPDHVAEEVRNKSIKSNIELWHWVKTTIDYGLVSYYYRLPELTN